MMERAVSLTSELGPQFLTWFVEDTRSGGDLFPIAATFPSSIRAAEALVYLVEAASLEAGITVDQMIADIIAARELIEPPENSQRCKKGGRPAWDWVSEYGESLTKLGLRAAIRHALGASKAEARRAALADARREAGKYRCSHDRLDRDGLRLKEATRAVRGGTRFWGKTLIAFISNRFPPLA